MEEIHYLYKITNLVNSKCYIGVTKNPDQRKKQHFSKNIDKLLTKAIKKYGKDCFQFQILVCGNKNYIYSLEEAAIKLYNSHAVWGHGYNIAEGGIGGSKPRRGKVEKRKDDMFVFVAGFWFPNKRTAINSLNWTGPKFRYRRDKGVLSEVCWENVFSHRNSIKTEPIYYRGFWFPGIDHACRVYNVNSENIKKDLRNRRYEENEGIQNYKIVKKHLVFGITYDSFEDAANGLRISLAALKGRYARKKDLENYYYTYIKQEV